MLLTFVFIVVMYMINNAKLGRNYENSKYIFVFIKKDFSATLRFARNDGGMIFFCIFAA